mgnify:CR=1 FL=1
MKIEYAGLKPIISEHGISFKDGKEDKYKYLKYAIDILMAIDHSYESKRAYSHNLNDKRLSPDEILHQLLKFHPNLESIMSKEIESYLVHLDEEGKDVENRKTLNDLEKSAYINNLKIMRDYKIQRAKNKIFYMHCIDTIVEIIIKYKIKEIDTPFSERFWHILQTIQGHLSSQKISATLKTVNDGSLKAILNINIY